MDYITYKPYGIIQNYMEMEKYYLMAIELNNSSAMYAYGKYQEINKNFEQMIKYYLMLRTL